jgi:hypothetical protein
VVGRAAFKTEFRMARAGNDVKRQLGMQLRRDGLAIKSDIGKVRHAHFLKTFVRGQAKCVRAGQIDSSRGKSNRCPVISLSAL